MKKSKSLLKKRIKPDETAEENGFTEVQEKVEENGFTGAEGIVDEKGYYVIVPDKTEEEEMKGIYGGNVISIETLF